MFVLVQTRSHFFEKNHYFFHKYSIKWVLNLSKWLSTVARLGSARLIRAGDKKKKKIKNTSLFFFYLYLRTLTKGNLLLSNLLFLWLPSFFISAFYYNYDYPTKESLYSSQELNFFFFFFVFQLLLFCGLDSEFQEQNSAEPSCFDLTIYIYFWFKVKIMHVMHRSSTPHMKWSKMVQSTDSVLLE